MEEQAIDRVHRLGQPQPVTHIFRFVVKDSVEQQMLEIQVSHAIVFKPPRIPTGLHGSAYSPR